MIFTSERPPIIRLNLGVMPWPDISTKKPTITIVEESGTGDVVPITGSREFINIPGTPIWYWASTGKVTIPDTNTNWLYYVTRGSNGEMIAEGIIEVISKDFFGKTKIVDTNLTCAGAVEIPASIGQVKTYPIRFTAYGQDGASIELDSVKISASWGIPTNAPAIGDANPSNTDMIQNGDNSYQFNWLVDNTVKVNIVTFTITLTYGTLTTSYHRTVELFRKNDFNPVRSANGVVI